jgi:hypothetical protein
MGAITKATLLRESFDGVDDLTQSLGLLSILGIEGEFAHPRGVEQHAATWQRMKHAPRTGVPALVAQCPEFVDALAEFTEWRGASRLLGRARTLAPTTTQPAHCQGFLPYASPEVQAFPAPPSIATSSRRV